MTRTSTAARPTIPAPEKIPIALTVNGIATQLKVAAWTTLLDALRDHLDLTGRFLAARPSNHYGRPECLQRDA